MRVDRENLLRTLESVAAGLANREIIEQSGSFVFKDGYVFTFNDEVACIAKSPLNIKGAVKAKLLLDYLSKSPDENLEIKIEEGKLYLAGKNRKTTFVMEAEIMLPIEHVEMPEEWNEINLEFSEAVKTVYDCASTEESQFVYCCVHVTPDFVETSDRFQIARYMLNTGISADILIRADALKNIIGLDVVEFSETNNWIHFRNKAGLTISVRRYVDEYLDFTPHLVPDGTEPITIPAGLDEVVNRTQLFSREDAHSNVVRVDLKPDQVIIEGSGPGGNHKERKKVVYTGTPIQFTIAPKLLIEISKKSNECRVGENRLFVDTGKLKYATCTSIAESNGHGEE